jgi:type 1 glutamine amidotransferase
MIRTRLIPFLAALLVAPAILAQAVTTPEPTRFVFLSGPKDHGAPGRHEYEKDLRVLAAALEAAPGIGEIETRFYVGEAPRNLDEIADADVFVIDSSSDRLAQETHPLFPPDPLISASGYDADTTAWLEGFDALLKSGKGIVVLHYATWAEYIDARRYYIDWLGGLWVQGVSHNPSDQWHMQPVNTAHPVLRGVSAWDYRDEVFTRFFLPDDPRRTDLLIGTSERDQFAMGPQVAAWAYQRDDGGRAFVFGGVDYHDAMLIEDYRKFLLNGIVWAAGRDVPSDGVQSDTPEGIEPYVGRFGR